MWQALRNELAGQAEFELVAVGLDTLGAEGCRPYIEAAAPEHPSLIDQHHQLAEKFGVINIPSSIWINEAGVIVRPAEAAPAPPSAPADAPPPPAGELPPRFAQMMGEAAKIQSDPQDYHHALRDWIGKGEASRFALGEDQVIARSRPRDENVALGHAHFELASALEIRGEHDLAISHFCAAHELVPDSWTFRRQAWSLEQSGVTGPLQRFWQGPREDAPEEWPYAGDWLTDVKKIGAENYSERFKP